MPQYDTVREIHGEEVAFQLPEAVTEAAAAAPASVADHEVARDVGAEGPAVALQSAMEAAVAAANAAVALADAATEHFRSQAGSSTGGGAAGKRNRVLYELDFRGKDFLRDMQQSHNSDQRSRAPRHTLKRGDLFAHMPAIEKTFAEVWNPHKDLTDRRPDASALASAKISLAPLSAGAPPLPPETPRTQERRKTAGRKASQELSLEADQLQQEIAQEAIPQAVLDQFLERQLAGDMVDRAQGAKDEPWFHGELSREEAEARLKDTNPGTFMMRASKSRRGLSLSIQTAGEGCKHFLVNHKPNAGYYIVGKKKAFTTISDLVAYYRTQPVRSNNTTLVFPCPRPAATAEETAYRESLYVDLLASELNPEVMTHVEQLGQQQAERKQTTRMQPAPYEDWKIGDGPGDLAPPAPGQPSNSPEPQLDADPPPVAAKPSPGKPGSTYIGPPLPTRGNTISVK